MVSPDRSVAVRYVLAVLATALLASCSSEPWPPGVQDVPDASPVLSPEQALETFYLPPGFSIELVASEPMVEDPVAIDFDAEGRLWVVEMRAYMPNVGGEGERVPRGRISVLEDDDGDGRMDRSTVFLDGLILPRGVKALDTGVLVAEPPYLWLARDTTGDLQADVREVVRDDYGRRESNPERNPNGLTWAMDNWILSAWYDRRLRVNAEGEWTDVETLDNAQWGLSIDDYGYVYKNFNEDPLRVDLVPGFYYARNPHLERTRGAYVDLVASDTVWPVRPTVGVNRGYRDHMLREDGTLAAFTAAGSPVVFRGDRLPPELKNDVFITEPSGNLVRRFAVDRGPGVPTSAANAYEEVQGEFLASTDERFRPVNLHSAPDGTLYVVDFYRGIVQHSDFLTEYLQDYIEQKGLDEPLGLGRIYRITHEDYEPDARPQLSTLGAPELVEVLEHPNGWRRDTAQRLLVERGDTSAATALRELAEDAGDERIRLHALWTLGGLGLEGAAAVTALEDASPHVRAAAVRLLENRPELLVALADTSAIVQRHLAAVVGSIPGGRALEAAAALLAEAGDDPVVVDAALSGFGGRELELLGYLLDRPETDLLEDALSMTAAAALHGGARTDVFEIAADLERSDRQRAAVLEGILAFAPPPPREASRRAVFEPILLDTRPAGLLTAAQAGEEVVRETARRALDRFTWPGKPMPERPETPPLTPVEQERFELGRERFLTTCAACHGEEGQGREGAGPALVASPWIVGDEDPLVRIVLHGKEGEQLMPPMRGLSDDDVAAVLTYVRRAWGHRASPLDPADVDEIRGRTASRDRPWTEEELDD